MYNWFFHKVLIGPRWLRVIECVFLLFLATVALMLWVYPWINDVLELQQNTVV